MFLALVLALLAAIAWCWAAGVWMFGGLSLVIGGVHVSSNDPWRPLILGVVVGAAAIWKRGPGIALTDLRRLARGATAERLAVALALCTAGVSLIYGSWTASGPDSFAYVSEAALFREGRLTAPTPLASEAPWPDATETFAPFGYHAARDGRPLIVPAIAPGVPLLMAALQAVGGYRAAYLVTPIAAAALVWLTFAIGRRLRSPAAGLTAAFLVATSPALLFMLMWPMTDVAAAAWTALMIWLLLGSSPASALGAGLAASAAILTRTNAVTIAAGAGLWLLLEQGRGPWPPRRWHRTGAFLAGLAPAVLLMGALNTFWFGSPVASGYGTVGQLFSVSYVWTNVVRYTIWIATTSPAALIGVAVLALQFVPVASMRRRARAIWSPTEGGHPGLLLRLIVVTTCALYFVYEPYDEWWYLRFLLPAWPALFVACGAGLDMLRSGFRAQAPRRPPDLRLTMAQRAVGWIVGTAVVATGIGGVSKAASRGVFDIGWGERRYVTIARIVAAHTEPDAVILTWQHAGTVRYYAGRETVRFDRLDPAWLDRAILWLTARHRHPYILVEDWEQPIFEARYGAESVLGRLSFPPVVAWESARIAGSVWLFDPLHQDVVTRRPELGFERAQPLCAPPAARPWPH